MIQLYAAYKNRTLLVKCIQTKLKDRKDVTCKWNPKAKTGVVMLILDKNSKTETKILYNDNGINPARSYNNSNINI